MGGSGQLGVEDTSGRLDPSIVRGASWVAISGELRPEFARQFSASTRRRAPTGPSPGPSPPAPAPARANRNSSIATPSQANSQTNAAAASNTGSIANQTSSGPVSTQSSSGPDPSRPRANHSNSGSGAASLPTQSYVVLQVFTGGEHCFLNAVLCFLIPFAISTFF